MSTLHRRDFAKSLLTSVAAASLSSAAPTNGKDQHLLYVASPGLRNYEEYGGVGVLVYDIDNGYKVVKRIPTWEYEKGQKSDNVKGICASAKTGHIYVTNITRMICIEPVTGKKVWDKTYEGGCDRPAITPNGKTLYVPQFEGPKWNVVNAADGEVITSIETKSASHNTICSLDGAYAYLAGIKSPILSVADTKTNKVARTVGPFFNFIRPFTVNGASTLVFVNTNALLGFEVGDLHTGKKLYHVEVEGYKQGPVKRHGCPSHGIALTHDETELWLADGANNCLHVFDATVMPPKQTVTIRLRDFPGWVSFSIDGKYCYSSTGEIIDAGTKKVVATLQDETERQVQSEKILDLTISNGKVTQAGNQFGVGMKRS
jgi:DNA-binding beta-propeller fold protein YncE